MNNSAGLDFSSGDTFEVDGRKAVVYDFRIPKKFTKEDMKALNRVTDTFSKLLTSGLCAMTRENCSVYNPRIEEMNNDAYLDSMPKYTMIGMLSFNIADSDLRDPKVMFHIPPELAFQLIDILLGGDGKEYEIERQHTDIEVAIMRYLITKFSDMLADAWSSIVEADFHYEKSETNPKLVDVKHEGNVKLVMTFDVSVKNRISSISIAYSAQFLEDLMSRIDNSNARDEVFEPVDLERDAKRRELILNTLSESPIEIKAVLSELTLDIKDVLSLRVGDIIPLDKKITDDITILADDVAWFKGKLGQVNMKKAVKITENIRDEE